MLIRIFEDFECKRTNLLDLFQKKTAERSFYVFERITFFNAVKKSPIGRIKLLAKYSIMCISQPMSLCILASSIKSKYIRYM